MPLVSIVTPSFNQARFLEPAIASVLEQDYPRVEHIVVDGGSTDGSVEILRRHTRLRWLSEPDRGQSDALNKGFAMARGEIFGWINADDLYLPGAIAAAVAAIRESGCGLVYGGWRTVDDEGRALSEMPALPWSYREQLEVRNIIAQPAAFFTHEAWRTVGGLDPEYHYAMDYDLWLKIGARFEVRRLDRPLAAFRKHEESKTGAQFDQFWPEVRRISRLHGGRFFSDMYVRHQAERHPRLGRVLKAYRLLADRDYRELLRKGAATLSRGR